MIQCAHDDHALSSLADVEKTVNGSGVPLRAKVALSKTFPIAVLLGTDVHKLGHLLGEPSTKGDPTGPWHWLSRSWLRKSKG